MANAPSISELVAKEDVDFLPYVSWQEKQPETFTSQVSATPKFSIHCLTMKTYSEKYVSRDFYGDRVKDGLTLPHLNCYMNNCYMVFTHMKTKLHVYYKCVDGLGPAPMYSLIGGPGSVSSHGPRLVDFVRSSCGVLDPSSLFSFIPTPTARSSQDAPGST